MFTFNVNTIYTTLDTSVWEKDSTMAKESMGTRKPSIRRKVQGAYHHGDLKASLKKAALRLVREKGPRGFSLNEASRLAGVTVGAPYRHFEDKDALLAEIATDGCDLMVSELREAAATATGVREKMLEVGMAYLRFSSIHADYFAVIFNAGLDKSKYPEVERAAGEAFGVIYGLSEETEKTQELAAQRAVSAWALAHGLATLTADGALSTAMAESPDFEHLRPVLRQFLSQPYGLSTSPR
jgi:AcrR family transcriptional regulator